jgi:histidine phosphotransferase ChpT
MDSLNLAEALATRLCHDLAGPVSSVGNGLELLATENDPAMQAQARDLLNMSAQEGITRLQFYRTCFGQLKDIRGADVEETRQMALAYFSRGTVKLDWPQGDAGGFDKEMPNAQRQMLCLMLLFVGGLLPYGGRISVRNVRGALQVRGQAKRVKEDADALAVVNAGGLPPHGLTPYSVIPCFTRMVAEKSGFGVHCGVQQVEEGVAVEFSAEYKE